MSASVNHISVVHPRMIDITGAPPISLAFAVGFRPTFVRQVAGEGITRLKLQSTRHAMVGFESQCIIVTLGEVLYCEYSR